MKLLSKICLCFLVGILSFTIPYSLFAANNVAPLEGDVNTFLQFEPIESPALVICLFDTELVNLGCFDPYSVLSMDGNILWSDLDDAIGFSPDLQNIEGAYPFVWADNSVEDWGDVYADYSLLIGSDAYVYDITFLLENTNPFVASVLVSGMHTETYASVLYVFAIGAGFYFVVSLFRGLFRPKRR